MWKEPFKIKKLEMFKTSYPTRYKIIGFSDDELINELTRPMIAIESLWDMDIKREALKRILIKLNKIEKKLEL